MKGALLKNSKEQRDKNKDGKIDFQEFIGDRGKDHDKQWLEDEKKRYKRTTFLWKRAGVPCRKLWIA